jgi:HSP20 family molecular chaperone IbpA
MTKTLSDLFTTNSFTHTHIPSTTNSIYPYHTGDSLLIWTDGTEQFEKSNYMDMIIKFNNEGLEMESKKQNKRRVTLKEITKVNSLGYQTITVEMPGCNPKKEDFNINIIGNSLFVTNSHEKEPMLTVFLSSDDFEINSAVLEDGLLSISLFSKKLSERRTKVLSREEYIKKQNEKTEE